MELDNYTAGLPGLKAENTEHLIQVRVSSLIIRTIQTGFL